MDMKGRWEKQIKKLFAPLCSEETKGVALENELTERH